MKIRPSAEIDVPNLHQLVKQARIDKGLSVLRASELAEINRRTWIKIESNTCEWIAEETLRAIERALEVDFGVRF